MPSAPRVLRARRPKRQRSAQSSNERGYTWKWREFRKAFIAEQASLGNTRCGICGKPITGESKDIHIDHKTPPSTVGAPGGEDYERLFWDTENLQMSHGRCNMKKQNRHG